MHIRRTLQIAARRILAAKQGAVVAELSILLPLALLSIQAFQPTVQPLPRSTETMPVEKREPAKPPVGPTPVRVQAENDFTSIGRYTLIVRPGSGRLSSLSRGPIGAKPSPPRSTAGTRPTR